MASAALSLQRAIYGALAADPGLTGLLGGVRVYDDVPQPASFPYLTLGQSSARDYGTAGGDGEEHLLTLHVWSRAAGKSETLQIIAAVREALHERTMTLADHRLFNLHHEFAEARRDPDGETMHGIVRYRAVTEPLA